MTDVGDLNTFRMELIPYGLWSHAVDAVAEDGNVFWCGGVQSGNDADGATEWDARSGWVSYYEPHLICGFATVGGLSHLKREALTGDSSSIRSIQFASLRLVNVYDLALHENLLWCATEFGIFVYDKLLDSGGFYKGNEGPFDRPVHAVLTSR